MGETFYGRETVIEIDLDALQNNINQFRSILAPDVRMMAAVKANAYGHGAVPIAKAALEAGVDALAVAFVDEGMQLRNAGIQAPILILGYTPDHAIEEAIRHRIAITVYHPSQLKIIHNIAEKLDIPAQIHIKVDTGMGRIGLQPEEVLPFLAEAKHCRHIFIEGIFTHFATADEEDQTYFHHQRKLFEQVIDQIRQSGFHIPIIHCANSAATIRQPRTVYNMVRIGISLYGLYPSNEVDRQRVRLSPILTFKSKIAHVKRPPAGWGISYGKTYTASGEEWIATVPVGYADGFSRQLSNRGFALVNGVRVPIVGRICMDQLMLDVTKAMPVSVGDEVVFYGRQGNEEITVDEVANWLNTIHYEVTSMLSERIPRIYLRNGKPCGTYHPLLQSNQK